MDGHGVAREQVGVVAERVLAAVESRDALVLVVVLDGEVARLCEELVRCLGRDVQRWSRLNGGEAIWTMGRTPLNGRRFVFERSEWGIDRYSGGADLVVFVSRSMPSEAMLSAAIAATARSRHRADPIAFVSTLRDQEVGG